MIKTNEELEFAACSDLLKKTEESDNLRLPRCEKILESGIASQGNANFALLKLWTP